MCVKLEVIVLILCLLAVVQVNKVQSLKDINVSFELPEDENELGIHIKFSSENKSILTGRLGLHHNFHNDAVLLIDDYNYQGENDSITVTTSDDGKVTTIVWTIYNTSYIIHDCFDLFELNWYGGPERYTQEWPIEDQILSEDDPYIIKKTDNSAVAERYWMSSRGIYFFVDDTAPLFMDINNNFGKQMCFTAKLDGPYINRTKVSLKYSTGFLDDPKSAHLDAVNRYLGKPKGHPNEKMIREPIWTTWAKFKKNIDDDTVLGFANDIASHGFTTGQIEIDEDWETCFGSHVFKEDKFARINETVRAIKDLGFRVTLWINPFVNNDCEEYSSYGLEKGYFVKNINGSTNATWWESSDAHQIDFTNPEAADWFSTRIRALLTNPGVDGFKFDAGETDYAISPSVYDNVDQELIPNYFTTSYIKTCAEFGDLIEVRSAWRTQEYPIFVRMIDKDSVWGSDDGLYSLVTTLLQMNLNGYTMVLPDMIGGNGYRQQPTAELIVRWAQANALMPAMQFSYLPWDFPSDEFNTTEIVRKFVKLHEDYGDEIIEAMEASIKDGTPVNPPIWWVDPTDHEALAVGDEFLLGENILVAPVLEEGATSRKIYLPAGSWKDGNDGVIYVGPITIPKYSAPIDVLPYFIKQ